MSLRDGPEEPNEYDRIAGPELWIQDGRSQLRGPSQYRREHLLDSMRAGVEAGEACRQLKERARDSEFAEHDLRGYEPCVAICMLNSKSGKGLQ